MSGMDRWSGKVAVVTGASAGIGAAIVTELVKSGMKVVGLARRVDRIEALQSKLKGTKGQLYPFKADVGKQEDLKTAFKWIKSQFGAVHVLVNNAGFTTTGKLVDGNPDDWKKIFDVNVLGLCTCTQEAFKLMKENGVNDGHIINISSTVSHSVPILPDPTLNVYPASKFAVKALAETYRQEMRFLKLKTKVTNICPGIVDTEFYEGGGFGTGFENMRETVKALQPQDVAAAVVYALSTPAHVNVKEVTLQSIEELV